MEHEDYPTMTLMWPFPPGDDQMVTYQPVTLPVGVALGAVNEWGFKILNPDDQVDWP